MLSYTVRGEGERRFNRHLTRLRNVLTAMPVEVFFPLTLERAGATYLPAYVLSVRSRTKGSP
jgi:hypothetical protein